MYRLIYVWKIFEKFHIPTFPSEKQSNNISKIDVRVVASYQHATANR